MLMLGCEDNKELFGEGTESRANATGGKIRAL